MSGVVFSFKVDGLSTLVQTFGQKFALTVQRISLGVGEIGKSLIAKYPGPSNSPVLWSGFGGMSPWGRPYKWGEKQRRAYFARRREAGLPAKYTRIRDPMSQQLGKHWEVKREGSTDAVLGNTTSYGKWAQAQATQWGQHAATGWVTDQQVADDLGTNPAVDKLAQQQIDYFFRRQG